MSFEERLAGDVLAHLLGAHRWVPRDVPGVNGMHDLDLVFDGGSAVAVEVTSHTAGNRAAFHAELDRANSIRAASLRQGWRVHIDVPDSDAENAKSIRPLFAKLSSELEPLLAQVERLELHQQVVIIRPTPEDTDEHPVCDRLRRLGVRHAQAFASQQAGLIWLQQAPVSTWYGADDVAAVAEHEIAPNRDKLLRAKAAGAAEAHLFVGIPGGASLSDAAHAAAKHSWDKDNHPRRPDLMGLDSVWLSVTGLPGISFELPGYIWPIWQLDSDGWHRWENVWG
ncbi:MAG: hypothetical protein F4064_08205 [Acidimicrobiales bacterium]|nr:hypothetical protein [Acidimicrobiales bacterium]